ncbi:aliphatic sulfonate ABC transporter ATP-binding protein [Acetobacter nitrogenifigens DSM 23921 = NBRC 105050]|uniref:Aliphatic sulfonate ABC transporter ATP-binding protein n=1 Tax=Acetobacter nitrogenifigens DSM 23921 = NBRC 105050 TaxID=1120919 RepID=A0A511XC36_9PROT|nr:ABC transporter ATP-binding protein [Acetobacter nitrogenifigens]GBQ94223.1 aliphatic sulfonate ABC transporter ATP-binding protein [Acetobacter nitrogenifigens DSM 23921 = NBRC 105050]GEN60529.1 aliphatic sulfonate ABC transporter ATP-binding protein [Acetobacter nitrogenifigens DSM 23921 = NBRC 105050]
MSAALKRVQGELAAASVHAASHEDGNVAVIVEGLTRRFGDGPAVLDRLDLAIAPGEFVALLGHSGSGKSTLLRTLAGIDPVVEGAVSRPREVSVVFQEHRLLPWKRVWENVVLGQEGKDGRDRAAAILEEVGLAHRIDAWPLTLSGGEAQRAALARALVREPGFLLLDEPFAALDALTRLKMQGLVGELWKRRRCAVLLVTHDVDEALLLADRAVVLERGRIRVDMPVALERPRKHVDPVFEDKRETLLKSLGVSL